MKVSRGRARPLGSSASAGDEIPFMIDPTHAQLVVTALGTPDPWEWCSHHRDQIDVDFLRAAKQQLDEALQSGSGEALALFDLMRWAAPMAEYEASLYFFTHISEDLERAKIELRPEDWDPFHAVE